MIISNWLSFYFPPRVKGFSCSTKRQKAQVVHYCNYLYLLPGRRNNPRIFRASGNTLLAIPRVEAKNFGVRSDCGTAGIACQCHTRSRLSRVQAMRAPEQQRRRENRSHLRRPKKRETKHKKVRYTRAVYCICTFVHSERRIESKKKESD